MENILLYAVVRKTITSLNLIELKAKNTGAKQLPIIGSCFVPVFLHKSFL